MNQTLAHKSATGGSRFNCMCLIPPVMATASSSEACVRVVYLTCLRGGYNARGMHTVIMYSVLCVCFFCAPTAGVVCPVPSCALSSCRCAFPTAGLICPLSPCPFVLVFFSLLAEHVHDGDGPEPRGYDVDAVHDAISHVQPPGASDRCECPLPKIRPIHA